MKIGVKNIQTTGYNSALTVYIFGILQTISLGPGLNSHWPHIIRRACEYLWNCNHAETNNAGNSINSTTLYTKNACTRNKIHLLCSFRPFLSKISKIKKYFPHHFCHILIYEEFMRKCLKILFWFHSLKNNWEFRTWIKTSVKIKPWLTEN